MGANNPARRLIDIGTHIALLIALPVILGQLAGCGGDSVSGGGQGPDAVVLDSPIAYVRRPVPEEDQDDNFNPIACTAGADLYLKDNALASGLGRNITASQTNGVGDVKDVQVSYDGTKLLFAMCNDCQECQEAVGQGGKWNIWEYDIVSQSLTPLISSATTANDGHDIAPTYIDDGDRIVFSSTRQQRARAIRTDEGSPVYTGITESRNDMPTLNLHLYDKNAGGAQSSDSDRIRQLTFNESHDTDPWVRASGDIVYARWDRAGNDNGLHLYQIKPNGTQMELLYGSTSHQTGSGDTAVQFFQPRELNDGRIVSLLRPFQGTELGSDLALVDSDGFIDNNRPVWSNISSTAQGQRSLTNNEVSTEPGTASRGGRFRNFYPFLDGTARALVSYAQCRFQDASGRAVSCERGIADNLEELPPLYAVWLYDYSSNTRRPVVRGEEGFMFTDVVIVQSRQRPAFVADATNLNSNTDEINPATEPDVAILNIRSVYDFGNGVFAPCLFANDCALANNAAVTSIADIGDPAKVPLAADRPARFLRIYKAVSIPHSDDGPDFDNADLGPNGQFMRQIIGYAPIEPDGSVRVKVPAEVPLSFDILDAKGQRISQRHKKWIHLAPREELKCHGCHNPNLVNAQDIRHVHGRQNAEAPSLNPGADVGGSPFPNTLLTENGDVTSTGGFLFQTGFTMAEARTDNFKAALSLSPDIVYEDVWGSTMLARDNNPAVSFSYADLSPSTPRPDNGRCTPWTALCRVVINYETHIHTLWYVSPRNVPDAQGVDQDRQCTGCHFAANAGNGFAVPLGDFELPANINTDPRSVYNEFLLDDFPQQQQVVDNVVVGVEDIPGAPALELRLRAGNAAGSRIFSLFEANGTHAGWLTPAELKLLREWVDMGGQYYNDLSAVPQN